MQLGEFAHPKFFFWLRFFFFGFVFLLWFSLANKSVVTKLFFPMMLLRLERPPKRELADHKRRLGVSDAELREWGERGDAFLFFFLSGCRE